MNVYLSMFINIHRHGIPLVREIYILELTYYLFSENPSYTLLFYYPNLLDCLFWTLWLSGGPGKLRALSQSPRKVVKFYCETVKELCTYSVTFILYILHVILHHIPVYLASLIREDDCHDKIGL